MVLKEIIKSDASTVFQEFYKIKSPKFINTVYFNDADPIDDIDFKKELILVNVDHNYLKKSVSLVNDIDFKKELSVDINRNYYNTQQSLVDDIDFKKKAVVNVDQRYFKIHPPLFVNTLYIDRGLRKFEHKNINLKRVNNDECTRLVKSRDELYQRGYQIEKRKFVNVVYIDKVSGKHQFDVTQCATPKTKTVDKITTKIVNQYRLNVKSSKFVNVLFYGMNLLT